MVAPSLLSADFANLEKEVKAVEQAGADWLHIDVMDGHFVPNLTIGVPVVKSLKRIASKALDVHLMIENPEQYVEAFAEAGADHLTIHIEATDKPRELLQKIKDMNVKPGITLRPGTDLEKIEPYLDIAEIVLVMTVEPGFGGQSFMEDQVKKIDALRDKVREGTFIEVDGGINQSTAALCHNADVLVAGSYVFGHENYEQAISNLKKAKK